MSKKISTLAAILMAAIFAAAFLTSCRTVPPEPLLEEEPPEEILAEVYEPEPPKELPNFEPNEFELRVFELVNNERRFRRLQPLIWDDAAFIAARLHSMDMHDNDFLRHRGSNGTNTGQRLECVGIKNLSSWAAGLGGGWLTPEDVVDAWMESPIYRENILRPEFTHTAVGFVERSEDSNARFATYWNQIFFTFTL